MTTAASCMAALVCLTHVELVVTDTEQSSQYTSEEWCEAFQEVIPQLLLPLPAGVVHISLTGLEGLTADVCNALASMPCLQSLSLRGIPSITMDAMIHLVGCVAGLERLQVVACEGFGLQQCKHLERGYGGVALRVNWEEYDLTRGDSV